MLKLVCSYDHRSRRVDDLVDSGLGTLESLHRRVRAQAPIDCTRIDAFSSAARPHTTQQRNSEFSEQSGSFESQGVLEEL